MADIFITAAGFFDGARFGNVRASREMSCPDVSALRWSEVSQAPFDRFGRLDGLCKGAMIAVEMLGLPPAGNARAEWAILVGTQYGSVEVDAAFFATRNQPGGASPLLFSYTLPSTVIGEMAIRHRITGPNACYMEGRDSGALALREGLSLIPGGKARACVCVGCDAASPPVSSEASVAAWAFLVEDAAHAAEGKRAPLAEIVLSPGRMEANERSTLPRLFEFLASGGVETEGFAGIRVRRCGASEE